jgi:hypothetical protein
MPQLFDQLRDFLAEVENEKQASVKKRAEANTETTAQGGPTTHPSKSQDDGTLPASEGKRSQENTGDVKDTIPAGGVDSAADKAPAQADQQHNVGITSTATGEDPSNEDNYKEKKDDPGTDHAAKAGEGEKYSSLSYGQLRKLAADKANNILADIIKSAEESAAEEKAEEKKELKGDQPKLDVNNNGKIEGSDLAALRAGKKKEEPKMAAARAGQAAASLTEQDQAELVKAAHAAVSGSLESTIADGLEKAAMVGAYLQSFYKAAAEGEAAGGSSEETHESPEQESSESPEEEAAEHASEEGGMDIDPALLSQMAGEEAAPGGMPEGAPEGDAVQELLMALQEQGVDPAQLLQMVEGGAGGPEAGADAAAMPKMGSAKKSDPETVGLIKLIKQAKSVRDNQIKAGKFRVTEAKTAQQRALRDQIKSCIRDIIG